MQSIFSSATGVTLPVVKASQATYDSKATYISLGYNRYSNSSGYSKNSALGTDGFTIARNGSSIYVLGEDYGTLYGVYGLMNDLVGYEFYYKDTKTVEDRTKLVLGLVKERTDIPDFENRAGGYGTMWSENDVFNPNRWGVKIYTNYFASVNGGVFHNVFNYLPYATHSSTHPKWYSDGTTDQQLCYTAHGDANEYSLMVKAVVEQLKTVAKNNPQKKYVSLSGLDNHGVCTCSTCSAKKTYYGSDAGAYIKFVNDVDKAFREWLNSQSEVCTDISINMTAYLKYLEAPTKHIDELIMRDGVSVTIAPIEAGYAHEFSASVKTIFNNWAKLTDNLGFWLYDRMFGYSLDGAISGYFPYYSENGMQARYQYLKSLGAKYVFCEGGSGAYGYQTAFSVLKMYLNSQLAWDADANVNSLISNFFANMYGVGATHMRAYYDAVTTHMADMVSRGVTSAPYGNWASKEYWDKATLLTFRTHIENALSAISSLQSTNNTLYKKLHMHIVAERISVNYMLIKLYGSSISNLETLKAELKSDIIESGLQSGTTSGEALYNSIIGQ